MNSTRPTPDTTRPPLSDTPVTDPDELADDVVDEAEPIAPPPAVEPAAGPPTLPSNDPPRRGF
jgi:hypothetical protein